MSDTEKTPRPDPREMCAVRRERRNRAIEQARARARNDRLPVRVPRAEAIEVRASEAEIVDSPKQTIRGAEEALRAEFAKRLRAWLTQKGIFSGTFTVKTIFDDAGEPAEGLEWFKTVLKGIGKKPKGEKVWVRSVAQLFKNHPEVLVNGMQLVQSKDGDALAQYRVLSKLEAIYESDEEVKAWKGAKGAYEAISPREFPKRGALHLGSEDLEILLKVLEANKNQHKANNRLIEENNAHIEMIDWYIQKFLSGEDEAVDE